MKKIYYAIFIALFSLSSIGVGAVELETSFVSYEISSQISSTIYEDVAKVTVVLLSGTDLSNVEPTFVLSDGAKAYVGDIEQISGALVDFSGGAIEYKVVNDTLEQLWSVSAIIGVQVTFNVDMVNIDLVDGDVVYVTGSFNGWNEPGTGASVLMNKEDGDTVYSATTYVAENSGEIKYKYFQNASWDNGDPFNSGTDRTLQIGKVNVIVDPIDVWAEEIVNVTFNVDMTKAELTETDTVYVTGSFVGWNEPGNGKSVLLSSSDDGFWTATVPVAKNAGEIKYKYFKNTTWANGDPFNGGVDRAITIGEESIVIDPVDVWDGIIDAVNQEELGSVIVYPNPFSATLTITNLENASEIIISNVIGQIIEIKSVSDSQTSINTFDYESGVYIVNVKDNAGNNKTTRIVKQ